MAIEGQLCQPIAFKYRPLCFLSLQIPFFFCISVPLCPVLLLFVLGARRNQERIPMKTAQSIHLSATHKLHSHTGSNQSSGEDHRWTTVWVALHFSRVFPWFTGGTYRSDFRSGPYLSSLHQAHTSLQLVYLFLVYMLLVPFELLTILPVILLAPIF